MMGSKWNGDLNWVEWESENVERTCFLFHCCRERSKNQKNFQLIIITHDEGFVELLGHTGYADSFFKVTKNVG